MKLREIRDNFDFLSVVSLSSIRARRGTHTVDLDFCCRDRTGDICLEVITADPVLDNLLNVEPCRRKTIDPCKDSNQSSYDFSSVVLCDQ